MKAFIAGEMKEIYFKLQYENFLAIKNDFLLARKIFLLLLLSTTLFISKKEEEKYLILQIYKLEQY